MRENAWRYIAIAAISALGGLVTGEYLPNRNIVTSDQLTTVVEEVRAGNAQIQNLRDEVNQMRGQLEAQKLLAPTRN